MTSEPSPDVSELVYTRFLGRRHGDSHGTVFRVDSKSRVGERLVETTATGSQSTEEAALFRTFGQFPITVVVLVVIFSVYRIILVFLHEAALVPVVV